MGYISPIVALDASPMTGGAPRFVLPGESQPTRGTLSAGQTAVVSVDTGMACRVGLDGELTKTGKHLDGWGLLADDTASVGVAQESQVVYEMTRAGFP